MFFIYLPIQIYSDIVIVILFFKINKMKLNFLNIKNFTCLILLLIFFNSCKYANHHTNMQPSHKLEENKKINIALVLSGAGSKGIAHAGVIAAFEKHNIPIDVNPPEIVLNSNPFLNYSFTG